jgi:hypothetical protein
MHLVPLGWLLCILHPIINARAWSFYLEAQAGFSSKESVTCHF